MKLITLYEADTKKAFELYSSFKEDENGYHNPFYGLNFEQFKVAVKEKEKNHFGIDLPLNHVPDTIYILEDNDNYVGVFNFRHYLNEWLKNGAGHIGYGIFSKYRHQGYASKGLKLLLEEVTINEDEFYLSVDKDNPYSLKVQLNNGAYIHHEDDDHYYTRIKKK